MSTISRREFFNELSKKNLKHLFSAVKEFNQGVKETSRRSCDEVAKMLFKRKTR